MPYVNNIYSGLKYATFPMTPQGALALDDLINILTENRNAESIVGITILPTELVPDKYSGVSAVKSVTVSLDVKGYFYDPLNDPSANNYYKPKNAKMFTAPYMFFNVECDGNATQYKFEKFPSALRIFWMSNWKASQLATNIGRIRFTASGGASPVPDIIIHPTDEYDNAIGKKNCIIISGFPQLPFVIDSYRAYVAQQGGESLMGLKNLLSVVTSLGGMAVGVSNIGTGAWGLREAMTPSQMRGVDSSLYHGMNGITSGIQNIVGTLTNTYVNTHRGDYAKGNVNFSSAMIATRAKNVYVSHMAVNLSDAKKIDNFFSMYGYAVNQIGVPSFNSRPYWNYIKTKQCNIVGEMPNEAIETVKSIFNNGITWWKSITTFLDYSQDNSPVVQN